MPNPGPHEGAEYDLRPDHDGMFHVGQQELVAQIRDFLQGLR